MKTKRYPMHEKLAAVKIQSQTCGEFLDWLNSKGYFLASFHEHTKLCHKKVQCGISEGYPYALRRRAEDLLAEFFGIDLRKLEAEKRAMLADIRGEAS